MRLNLYTLDVLNNVDTLVKPYNLMCSLSKCQRDIRDNFDKLHLENYYYEQCYNSIEKLNELSIQEINQLIYEEFETSTNLLYDYFLTIREQPLELFKSLSQVQQAFFKRVGRLKDRVRMLVENDNCYFITLTFNDDIMNKVSENTRHDHVKRFLKAVATNYVANIDYGAQGGREHYHAVVNSDFKLLRQWYEKYNSDIHIKKVSTKDNDTIIRLCKYVSKLTNHAIKETTKTSRIMYSRGFKNYTE